MGAMWLRVAESRWMRMGVVLLTSAGALLVFTPVVRAMASSSDGEFNRWVGWANILALPIGFAGLALAALGWLLRPRRLSADDLDGVADVLAEGMLHAYLDGLKQMIGGDVGDAIRLSLLSDEPAPRWRSSPDRLRRRPEPERRRSFDDPHVLPRARPASPGRSRTGGIRQDRPSHGSGDSPAEEPLDALRGRRQDPSARRAHSLSAPDRLL
ncbi:hypothetical protein GCM10027612_55960 [Microbispora bryophytorum subsp. camponoti]